MSNINPKQQENYLGQKGYTIYKNKLSLEQQKIIKDDLTVTPNQTMPHIKQSLFQYIGNRQINYMCQDFMENKNLVFLKKTN